MKWNLEQLYINKDAYNKELNNLTNISKDISKYEGKLNNKESFIEFYDLLNIVDEKLETLYCYARMNHDLNQKDINIKDDYNKIVFIYEEISTLTSFVDSEIISIGQEKVLSFIKGTKHEANTFSINDLFRSQKYIKTAKEELLMSHFSLPLNNFNSLYDQLSTADNNSVEVTLSNNEKLEINVNNFRSYLQKTEKQSDRKIIFEAVFKHFDDHKNTYASIYQGIIQSSSAEAKARGYNNVIDMVLYQNNISKDIYLNLINITKENTAPVKKYFNLRKKYFNIDTHYTYDRALQFKESKTKFTYENSKDIVLESISSIGGEFYEFAQDVLASGQVDVNVCDGKTSGAYSMGIINQEPFILLNHTNTIDDCFTLAHEAGHSIHTKFSSKYQPKETANYTLFVAEIASIFNEHLLLDHLLEKITDKDEKIVMLQSAIDGLLGTFYRQSLFADYEYKAHKYCEENGSLNYEVLSNIMVDLYKQYYDLDLNDQLYKKNVWSYVPHFFSTEFYVYQYATSYAASIMMYDKVKNHNGLDDYLTLLKSGGSDYPVELVKKANVDLTTKEPFISVCKRLEELVNELESLLGE